MKPLYPLLVLFTSLLNLQSNYEIHRVSIVFTNVAVIDTAGALLQEDMPVVVLGDYITDGGKASQLKPPRHARVIDGHGKFLIPGLWDMHIHTFRHNPRSTDLWFFPLFIANGVTGVRDMWTTGDDFPSVVQWRKGLADGTFLGPRFGAVGWLVDGPEPFWPNSDVVSTPQQAREFVQRVKSVGVDFVKVYWKLPREEYFAIADESNKLGIPFAGHVPFVISAAEASDAGQKTIEHLLNVDLGCSTKEDELLQAKVWGAEQANQMLGTYDEQKCEHLMKKFVRNQTWQVPTLVVHEVTSPSDPRLKYVPASTRAARNKQAANETLSEKQKEVAKKVSANRLKLTAAMAKAGVPLLGHRCGF